MKIPTSSGANSFTTASQVSPLPLLRFRLAQAGNISNTGGRRTWTKAHGKRVSVSDADDPDLRSVFLLSETWSTRSGIFARCCLTRMTGGFAVFILNVALSLTAPAAVV